MTLQTLLEPLEINHMTLKNRIMFPPMTTGYEARDGSITEQSINFYKRVAEGGASYIVLGDVTPVHTISPTPKLVTDEQILVQGAGRCAARVRLQARPAGVPPGVRHGGRGRTLRQRRHGRRPGQTAP